MWLAQLLTDEVRLYYSAIQFKLTATKCSNVSDNFVQKLNLYLLKMYENVFHVWKCTQQHIAKMALKNAVQIMKFTSMALELLVRLHKLFLLFNKIFFHLAMTQSLYLRAEALLQVQFWFRLEKLALKRTISSKIKFNRNYRASDLLECN